MALIFTLSVIMSNFIIPSKILTIYSLAALIIQKDCSDATLLLYLSKRGTMFWGKESVCLQWSSPEPHAYASRLCLGRYEPQIHYRDL